MKTRIQPIDSLSSMLYDSAAVALRNKTFNSVHPVMNMPSLSDEANSFMVSLPVPGLSKEDILVHTDGRLLLISIKDKVKSASRLDAAERNDVRHSFVLPNGIDTNRIRAKCRHGLLTITADKVKARKKHTIKVGGAESEYRNTSRLQAWWAMLKDKMVIRNFAGRRISAMFVTMK